MVQIGGVEQKGREKEMEKGREKNGGMRGKVKEMRGGTPAREKVKIIGGTLKRVEMVEGEDQVGKGVKAKRVAITPRRCNKLSRWEGRGPQGGPPSKK